MPDNAKPTAQEVVELDLLVGEHILQGVEYGSVEIERWYSKETVTCVKFMLDGKTYTCHEDPDDGYRSHCSDIAVSEEPIIFNFPGTSVLCSMMDEQGYYGNDVLVIKDAKNGMTILEIGTKNTNDYYPWFHCEYTPENMSVNQEAPDA